MVIVGKVLSFFFFSSSWIFLELTYTTYTQRGLLKWTITHLGGMNNSKMKCFFYCRKLNIEDMLCISSKSNGSSLLSQAAISDGKCLNMHLLNV